MRSSGGALRRTSRRQRAGADAAKGDSGDVRVVPRVVSASHAEALAGNGPVGNVKVRWWWRGLQPPGRLRTGRCGCGGHPQGWWGATCHPALCCWPRGRPPATLGHRGGGSLIKMWKNGPPHPRRWPTGPLGAAGVHPTWREWPRHKRAPAAQYPSTTANVECAGPVFDKGTKSADSAPFRLPRLI